jgi:hypothetical protein
MSLICVCRTLEICVGHTNVDTKKEMGYLRESEIKWEIQMSYLLSHRIN